MNKRRKIAAALGAVLLLFLWWVTREEPLRAGTRRSHAQVLRAIRFVESGWRKNVPDGDGGKAIGPYQIHRVYWLDAIRAQPELGGSYQTCRERVYAERVIEAYMQLYVPDAWERVDAEVIARTHNGGPNGSKKKATLRYWQRVRAALR